MDMILSWILKKICVDKTALRFFEFKRDTRYNFFSRELGVVLFFLF